MSRLIWCSTAGFLEPFEAEEEIKRLQGIEKRQSAENSAAKKMRNEIVGFCSLGEHYMREFAGNTNYNCLIDAVKEFDRVSTEQTPVCPETAIEKDTQ